MSANDIRALENLDQISEEEGGNLYLINGNMTKLKDAGSAYSVVKEVNNNEEILAVEEQKSNESRKPRRSAGTDAVS